MAVTQVALKVNKAGAWTFQTDATNTFTDPIMVLEGQTVYWNIGAGLNGTYQLQSAAPGTNTFAPTPFNGSVDISTGGTTASFSGSFTAPANCVFRIALTAFTAGSATIRINK